jgi:hypothetical protein
MEKTGFQAILLLSLLLSNKSLLVELILCLYFLTTKYDKRVLFSFHRKRFNPKIVPLVSIVGRLNLDLFLNRSQGIQATEKENNNITFPNYGNPTRCRTEMRCCYSKKKKKLFRKHPLGLQKQIFLS